SAFVPTSLQLLILFRQHRHDLEQIADDAVVGDVEDGRFGVFVDGDDCGGVLHADEVLNRAGDAEREVELRRYSLTGGANLPVNREPARVADGARGRDVAAQGFGQFLRERDVLLTLDAATDGDYHVGLRQINRLLQLLERRFRLHPHLAHFDLHRLYARALAPLGLIASVRARLECDEDGRLANSLNVCVHLAEEDAACERHRRPFGLHAYAVADETLAE